MSKSTTTYWNPLRPENDDLKAKRGAKLDKGGIGKCLEHTKSKVK